AIRPGEDTLSSAASSARAGRVLVVDDNHDALVMLLDALRQAAIDAVGAGTAKETMHRARETQPDVAVLDIGLPDINGFDLARALRALPGGPWIRLIAVTGYGREQDKAAARAAGFDAFFAKPVDVTTLLEAMERVVSDTRQGWLVTAGVKLKPLPRGFANRDSRFRQGVWNGREGATCAIPRPSAAYAVTSRE